MIRAREGLGIGLALARRIAELHGGSLSIRPLPGGGTEAGLILPRA
jgi:signal transduction histidine kinase